jgi:dihydroorotase/N-acyl-D-amino-acid deacylase
VKPLLGTIVVKNMGGGGSSLGAASVARSRPDGYTILLSGSSTHITEALLKNRPLYDPLNDLEPISNIAISPFGLAINPCVPRKMTNMLDLQNQVRRVCPLAVAAIAISLLIPQTANAQTPPHDLVLRNARIVDGSGKPVYRGDVAISGDVIAAIAPRIEGGAKRVIDVGNQVVAPGFIDVHTHVLIRRGIFEHPTADNYVRQGVTTVIEGPDGRSPVPIAPLLRQLAALPKSINIGTYIGQGSVRTAVMGRVDRPASPEELDKMRTLVERGMRDGAFGLSSGLMYVPGTFTPFTELVELAKVAGRLGGHYQSHIRDEGSRVVEAVREAIAVGEQGGLPTQVTHHKTAGRANWGRSVETLRLIDQARARGVDATIDQYPYDASGGGILSGILPTWVLEGGREAVHRRLKDGVQRAKIKEEVTGIIRRRGGPDYLAKIVISHCQWDESLGGKTLADLARLRGKSAGPQDGAEVTLWIADQGDCEKVLRNNMSEADIERILKHPATMVASDGEIPAGLGDPNAGPTHPRSYGTFARVLGVYVRERKLITLEEAVRKMSSFPAQRLGLRDRGSMHTGMKADLVVFDPARVRDAATYDKSHQYAEGIPLVIVNGQVVFENNAMTPARPGRVLYGPAKE